MALLIFGTVSPQSCSEDESSIFYASNLFVCVLAAVGKCCFSFFTHKFQLSGPWLQLDLHSLWSFDRAAGLSREIRSPLELEAAQYTNVTFFCSMDSLLTFILQVDSNLQGKVSCPIKTPQYLTHALPTILENYSPFS